MEKKSKSKKEERINELLGDVARLNAQLTAEKMARAEAEKELVVLIERNERSELSLRALREEVAEAQKERAERREEERLKAALSAAEERAVRAEADASQKAKMFEEAAGRRAAAEEKASAAEAERDKMALQLEKVNSKIVRMKKKVNESEDASGLERELRDVSEKLVAAKVTLAQLEGERLELRNGLYKLKAQNSALKQRLTALEVDNVRLKSK